MRVLKFIKLCVIMLLCLSVFSACGTKSAFSEEELINVLQKPTVMITVGSSHASGVIVRNDDKGLVLASVTHLLNGYEQGIIRFADDHAGFADVAYCDEKSDITLLTIKRSDMDASFADSLKTVVCDEAAYDALATDDTVYVVGSAVDVAANVTKGTFKEKDYYVPEFDQYLLYLYCDSFPGMSGAGVYTTEGKFLGLVAGGSDNSETVVIELPDILKALESLER